MLRLNPRENHGKLWRPSVLLLTHNMASPLLQVCNYLKRGGIYVVGDVIVAQHLDDISRKELEAIEQAWLDRVADSKIKVRVLCLHRFFLSSSVRRPSRRCWWLPRRASATTI